MSPDVVYVLLRFEAPYDSMQIMKVFWMKSQAERVLALVKEKNDNDFLSYEVREYQVVMATN